jgi:thioredoxin reductase
LFTRFNVPFGFRDVDSEQGRRLLQAKGLDTSSLPVVIRHDGYTMVRPTPAQIIEATGGTVSSDVGDCDVVIVGAGPGGLTAGVYAASEGLRTVVLEETVSGGQAGNSSLAHTTSDYLIREIEATGNITLRLRTEVTDGHGDDHLETLTLYDKLGDRAEQVPAAALFVLIGGEPRTQWLPDAVQLEGGYILTGRDVVPDRSHPMRRR